MATIVVTISELKRSLTNELTSIYSSGEAQSISRLILEHLGFQEISILKEPSTVIDYKIQAEIRQIVGELKNNRPIQYVLGETEFYGLKLKVDKNVLIPRSETEELVSHIIAENKQIKPVVLDIGTGSGCIPIALGSHIECTNIIAIDVDERALEIARGNALDNKVGVRFIKESIFEMSTLPIGGKVDILVSNPPYVTVSEKKLMNANVTEFEPGLALFVPDDDPLMFYKEIIRLANDVLADDGVIWLEINEAFGQQTLDMIIGAGFEDAILFKDIHEKDRFIKAKKKHE
jgi:release factor glutamine methyltransferase